MTPALWLGLALLALSAVRVWREPRRVSTGLLILVALLLTWVGVSDAVYQHDAALGAALGAGLLLVVIPLGALVTTVALIVNGVTVVRREGLRVATLLPLGAGLAAVGAFVAAAMLLRGHAPGWALSLALLVLGVAALFGFELVAFTLYAVLYGRLPLRHDSDVVVALGCGLAGAEVTPLLASRLDRAVAVYRELSSDGRRPLLVTSGGQGPGEDVPEAQAMGDYVRTKHAIPAEDVRQEEASTTTDENLRLTRELLDREGVAAPRWTVVTSDFHVLRTATLTRRHRIAAQVTGGRTARYYLPTAFLREFVAVVVHYRVANALAVVAVAALTLLPGLLGGPG